MIEVMSIAKLGVISIGGKDGDDAKKKLAAYLQSAAGKEQFCEGLDTDEAEEKYQAALFQCYEEGNF